MPPGLTLVLRLFPARVLYQRRVTAHDRQSKRSAWTSHLLNLIFITCSIGKAGFEIFEITFELDFLENETVTGAWGVFFWLDNEGSFKSEFEAPPEPSPVSGNGLSRRRRDAFTESKSTSWLLARPTMLIAIPPVSSYVVIFTNLRVVDIWDQVAAALAKIGGVVIEY